MANGDKISLRNSFIRGALEASRNKCTEALNILAEKKDATYSERAMLQLTFSVHDLIRAVGLMLDWIEAEQRAREAEEAKDRETKKKTASLGR